MTSDKLFDKKLFTLDNVLSKEECNHLISMANGKGWKKSAPMRGCNGHSDKEIQRISSLCVIFDKELAHQLWNKVYEHLPKDLTHMYKETNPYFDKIYKGTEWTPLGVFEKMRLYKYLPEQSFPEQSFPEHNDYKIQRTIITEDGEYVEQSFTSLLVYLNDDFNEGQTKYWPDETCIHCRFKKDVNTQLSKQHQILVTPETGKAIIQSQDILYEGLPPKKGIKYLLRTDILYVKKIERSSKLKSQKPHVGQWERIFEA